MKIVVYVSALGKLAMTDALFLPSAALEKMYGVMELCGNETVADDTDTPAWNRMVVDVDELTYALITLAEGKHLLGAKHRCFRKVNRLLRDAAIEV